MATKLLSKCGDQLACWECLSECEQSVGVLVIAINWLRECGDESARLT